MAPIKFEDNIKEKLEQRRLQPSDAAWGKLAQKLDANGFKRKGFGIWWFGVAASLIGVLLIINQMDRGDSFNPKNTNKEVVTSNRDTINESLDHTMPVSNNELVIHEEHLSDTGQSSEETSGMATNAGTLSEDVSRSTDPSYAIKEGVVSNQVEKIDETNLSIEDQVILDSTNSSKDLIAQSGIEVEIHEDHQPKLDIDLEVDALLSSAITNSDPTSSSQKIDPKALLESVETEMPPSIRRQVLKVIEKNYKTVKTAVVTRNK